MCGIYGTTDKSVDIKHMMSISNYRGPDGSSVFSDDNITMAHNLLSITDEPLVSIQPWITPKGNVLVYNGEIFNYQEMKRRYAQFTAMTSCDTELLAWGLDNVGLKFINEIDSMHGFAYYRKHEGELVLSRDHAGLKPLYYSIFNDNLLFASEIKNIHGVGYFPKALDLMALSFVRSGVANLTGQSLFKNIKSVMPGETLVFDLHHKIIKSCDRFHILPRSNRGYDADEFRQRVQETVRMTSVGKREIGLFLSGGLDSGMIAYELNKIIPNLKTFTNRILDDRRGHVYNDDAEVAKRLAGHMGFDHREILIDHQTVIDNWQRFQDHNDDLMQNMSNVMYYATYREIAQQGVVVTMTGDMGDELLCGYARYHREHAKKFRSGADMIKRYHVPVDNDLFNFLDVEFVDHASLVKQCVQDFPDRLWNPEDPINSLMLFECYAQLPNEFLKRSDRFGMACSMENRSPFATKMFMQYCMDMHSSHKSDPRDDHKTKLPARMAYENLLPPYITQKGKTGWTLPLGNWISEEQFPELNGFFSKHLGMALPRSHRVGKKTAKRLGTQLVIQDWFSRLQGVTV